MTSRSVFLLLSCAVQIRQANLSWKWRPRRVALVPSSLKGQGRTRSRIRVPSSRTKSPLLRHWRQGAFGSEAGPWGVEALTSGSKTAIGSTSAHPKQLPSFYFSSLACLTGTALRTLNLMRFPETSPTLITHFACLVPPGSGNLGHWGCCLRRSTWWVGSHFLSH